VRLPTLDRHQPLHQNEAANRNPDEQQEQEQAENYSDMCTPFSISALQHFSFLLMAWCFWACARPGRLMDFPVVVDSNRSAQFPEGKVWLRRLSAIRTMS
jgi:hypothetical protein